MDPEETSNGPTRFRSSLETEAQARELAAIAQRLEAAQKRLDQLQAERAAALDRIAQLQAERSEAASEDR